MVSNPREVLKEGQIVTLRVMRVEPEQKRIALSLKRVSWAEYADMDWQSEVPAGETPAPTESAEPTATSEPPASDDAGQTPTEAQG